MNQQKASNAKSWLAPRERIEVLLEEYNALYSLLLFRLNALDRRLPATSGFITAGLAAALALPQESQTVVLVGTPVALLWLARTTVQHAKAKEDNLRRIEEIERAINNIAGESLLEFQSRHPNLGNTPAGRSGSATVAAITFASLFILALSLLLFLQSPRLIPDWLYSLYSVVAMLGVATAPLGLSKYRYAKRPPEILSLRWPKYKSHS